jgi:hypothetical protein
MSRWLIEAPPFRGRGPACARTSERHAAELSNKTTRGTVSPRDRFAWIQTCEESGRWAMPAGEDPWDRDGCRVDARGARPDGVDLGADPADRAGAPHRRDASERARLAEHPAPRLPGLGGLVPARARCIRWRSGAERHPAGPGRDIRHAGPVPRADPGIDRRRPARRERRPERLLPGRGRIGLRRAGRVSAGALLAPARLAHGPRRARARGGRRRRTGHLGGGAAPCTGHGPTPGRGRRS